MTLQFVPPELNPTANCHQLETYALRVHPLTYQHLREANRTYSQLGIPIYWPQWMLAKPLSAFTWKEWSIFCGIAARLRSGEFRPTEVRQYVEDLFDWAQTGFRIHELMFEMEPWPQPARDFIDIPMISD